MQNNRYTLYIDESGIRYPQHKGDVRKDGMDWFGWGGVLVNNNDIDSIVQLHKDFCARWEIGHPLHSTEIRGRRDNFFWLSKDEERAATFFVELNEFLTNIPVIGFSVVVSRPGYNKKFREKYGNERWELCKTTHPILIERVVRYLQSVDPEATLKVVFEGSSGAENKKVVTYAQELKNSGHPFDKATSEKYKPLTADIYQKVISGRPEPGTKSNIFLQIADLYVYPMVKYKYDPGYLAWLELYKSKSIINALLAEEQIESCGIKYYCFDI